MRGEYFLGFFGKIEGRAVVENLNIEDARIIAEGSWLKFGLMAAENSGRIANCHVTGSISFGDESLAMFVGVNHGVITDCDPAPDSGPYTAIVNSLEATREFLRFRGISFNEVWIPDGNDVAGLDVVVKEYLDSDLPVDVGDRADQEYILANLGGYNREYSGFVKDGIRYIICNMHISWEGHGPLLDDEPVAMDEFTIISHGGCDVIFDAGTKVVVSIHCNGVL